MCNPWIHCRGPSMAKLPAGHVAIRGLQTSPPRLVILHPPSGKDVALKRGRGNAVSAGKRAPFSFLNGGIIKICQVLHSFTILSLGLQLSHWSYTLKHPLKSWGQTWIVQNPCGSFFRTWSENCALYLEEAIQVGAAPSALFVPPALMATFEGIGTCRKLGTLMASICSRR